MLGILKIIIIYDGVLPVHNKTQLKVEDNQRIFIYTYFALGFFNIFQ